MAKARYEFGYCSACRKKIDVFASKCPWCHSELEAIVKTRGQYLFVLWFTIIGTLLSLLIYWYTVEGGSRSFKKGEIEGAIHLYPSDEYIRSEKRNIKQVVFKKTYEFNNSKDRNKFVENVYPVRSKCFKEVFTVLSQKFPIAYDSLINRPSYRETGLADNIDKLINNKDYHGSLGGDFGKLTSPLGEYEFELYSYVPHEQKSKYPNIKIYCRYKDAIHKDLK
jgi:hypothetical protein